MIVIIIAICSLVVLALVGYLLMSAGSSTNTTTNTGTGTRPALTSSDHTTPFNDTNGNIIYLDRHDIRCPAKSVLNQMRVVPGPTSATFRYNYKCLNASDIPAPGATQLTTLSDTGIGGPVEYLDRQFVQCATGTVLAQTRLKHIVNGGTSVQYEYQCTAVPGLQALTACETRYTSYNERNGHMIYLDRHDVACPNGKMLSGFGLRTNPANVQQIRYEYKCCSRT